MRLSTLVLALSFAAPVSAFAQSHCAALLNGGVFEVTQTSSDERYANSLRQFMCRNVQSRSSRDTGVGVNLLIPNMPTPLGFSFTDSSRDTRNENICRTDEVSAVAVSAFRTYATRVSEPLIKAYTDCLRAGGIQFGISRGGNLNQFVLSLSRQERGEVPPVNVTLVLAPHSNGGRDGRKISCDPAIPSGPVAVGRDFLSNYICQLDDPSDGVTAAISGNYNFDQNVVILPGIQVLPIFIRPRDSRLSTNGVARTTELPEKHYDLDGNTLMNDTRIVTQAGERSATWKISVPVAGRYSFYYWYAAPSQRPLSVSVNGIQQISEMGRAWDGGTLEEQRLRSEPVELVLPAGPSVEIKLAAPSWPHFGEGRLVFREASQR